jgi:bifunctional enzyme CysN/CysC
MSMHSTIEAATPAAQRSGGGDSRKALRVLVCGASGAGKSALLDGLQADGAAGGIEGLAWRRFAAGQRPVIAADTVGDENFVRAVMEGAGPSDLAVLVVDARNGLFAQTYRHAIVASLMGIRHVVLAVNKMDLAGYDGAVFDDVCGKFQVFAAALGFAQIACIPLSARDGENVAASSARMPWYKGRSLRDHLATVDAADERAAKPFRMPVETVDSVGTVAGTAQSLILIR